MTRTSGIILLAITSTLFAHHFADAAASNSTCSALYPQYKIAKEEFREAYQNLVTERFTADPNSSINTTVLVEKAKSLVKVTNETCRKDILNDQWNHTIFMNFLEFSLKNVTLLRDLQKNGTFKCISKQKNEIKNCVAISGVGKWNGGTYIAKAHLNIDLTTTCIETNLLRNCTVELLKKHSCDITVNYVESLFNYMLQNYCTEHVIKSEEKHDIKSSAVRISGLMASFSMLALIL